MFIVKLILFLFGCGLVALSICIKFDVLKIKKYEDPNNLKEKEDMCYYLLIAAIIFLLLLLIWIIIEESITLGKKGYEYGRDKAGIAKQNIGVKYQSAKKNIEKKYKEGISKIQKMNKPKVAYIQE
jgi:hypothetical protein